MGAERELHFDFVDGLRAVAVVAVMLYHLDAALLPGGFVGVDVFFVVSGFVVSASLAGHRAEAALAFLARFYARRLARLMPALLTMLVATIAAYVLLVPRAWFNRAADDVAQAAFWGFSNLVLDHQAVSYFEPRAELNPFTHTWSLGVEEQFYLVAPLLLLWAFRSEARPAAHSRAVGLLALLAALSLAACLHHGVVQGARHVFYPLVFRFWELATGVLLFVGRPALARLAARWDPAGGRSAAAGGLLLAACLLAPKPQFHPYLRAAGAVAATALLIGAARLPMRDGLRGALAHTALVWIGLRSYALYLWHWPVYVLARWIIGLGTGPLNAIALCVTLLLATASYRFIEQPFRRSPRLAAWPPRRRITLGLAMIATGSAAGAALLAHQAELGLGRVTREAADWYPERQLLKTARAAQRRCEPVAHSLAAGPRQARGTRYEPVSCPVRAAGQLFVIGDSHATAYAPLFEQLSAEEGRSVTVLSAPGCGFLDLGDAMTPAVDRACHDAAQTALQTVLAQGRPGDLVFLSSLRLPRLVLLGGKRRQTAEGRDGDRFALNDAERAALARAAADAARWLEPMLAAGLRVVIEAPKPLFGAHPFACVEWWQRGNPECAAGLALSRADFERYRAPALDALRALAAAQPGLAVWDPVPELCDAQRCEALRDGRPLFFDGDHLSPHGNLRLLPAFQDLLRSASAPP